MGQDLRPQITSYRPFGTFMFIILLNLTYLQLRVQLLGLLKHENNTLTAEVLHVLSRIQKTTSPVGLLWKTVISQQIVTRTTAITRVDIATEKIEALLKITCQPMSKTDCIYCY